MSVLRNLLCLAVLGALAMPGWVKGDPVFEIHRFNNLTVKVISNAKQPNPNDTNNPADIFNGSIIDINNAQPPKAPISEQLKIYAGNSGADITELTSVQAPIVNIIYWFLGLSADQQCRYKVFLDGLLVIGQGPNLAFAEIENDSCPNFRIHPGDPSSITNFIATNGYSRILLIEVLGEKVGNAPRRKAAALANLLTLTSADFADRKVLAGTLGRFFRENTNGVFIQVPSDILATSEAIKLDVYRGDQLYHSFELRAFSLSRLLGEAIRDPRYVAVGAGAIALAIIAALIFVLVIRRKAKHLKPLREITIGHGPAVDISLGDGEARILVILRVLKDGAIELEKQTSKVKVQVNGKSIGRRAKISSADQLAINGKNIRFS